MVLDLINVEKGFLLSGGNRFVKNVIIFGADVSSSVHFHNRKKDILKPDSHLPKSYFISFN